MKQVLILVLTLTLVGTVFSQTNISYFKSISDKEIQNHFDPQIFKNIKCDNFTTIAEDSTETWYSGYESNKNLFLKLSEVSFSYSFYSKSIRNKFEFTVTVFNNKKVDTNFLNTIPFCILKNSECGYITKDSAIAIAKNDSILYSNNISAEFEKPYYKKEFYWVIEGENVPKGTNAKKTTRSSTKRSVGSVKYINAKTGELISWQKYNLPD
jgi:hypothetical protein